MIYFEDMVPGEHMMSPTAVIDRDEMIDFAKRWDPLPIHVDDDLAARHGGLTAPGLYVLAVKQHLIHQLPAHAVIASFGYDEVRFHHPLRPGDEVYLRYEFVEARPSTSKPDRGVVTVRLSLINNNNNEVVMSHLDTILVRRKPPHDS